MRVKAFVQTLARQPFAWGERDCVMILADWWLINHGVDLAADLRGTYRTEEECRAVLAREGGVLRLVARRLRAAGAERAVRAEAGAIGVLRWRGVHVGAICVGVGQWAGKSPGGVSVVRGEAVAAWKV